MRFVRIYLPFIAAAAIISMLSGYFLADKIIMPLVVGKHRSNTVVPSVVGLNVKNAEKELKDNDLKLYVAEEEIRPELDDGTVLSQEPVSDSRVKHGRSVYVTVSKGSSLVPVPNVSGLERKEAESMLQKEGLTPGLVEGLTSNSVPSGRVITTDPPPGTAVPSSIEISLFISKGSSDGRYLNMPDLKGMEKERAIGRLRALGIAVRKISYAVEPGAPEGIVLSQSLSPGVKIQSHDVIDLVISAGN
ncbi:MAG: PASTA domain-containing protein [Fibrobacterota bacterium]